MYGYVLQDWLTLSSASNAVILQNESDWLGFSSFQDIAFWIDIRGLTPPTAGNLKIDLQTSPTKDDAMFGTLTNCTTGSITAPPANVVVVKNLLSTNPANPLATWVRWSLTPSVAAAWSITFRIFASANRVAP
jgi:hypothetical protein